MTEGYFFYEMAERPLVTSQSSVDEGRRMAELSTSFSPSEADVEAAVTFKGVEAEGSGARYRGQSDSQHDPETEGFIDIPGIDATAQALDTCEKWVLRPYRIMLKMLGWTSFSGDSFLFKIIRWSLVSLWVLVILTAFITQILSCFRRDMIPGNLRANDSKIVISCENGLVSSYLLTDVLLLASYLFGLYLFSRGETEYLSNLAEQVFIKTAKAKDTLKATRWIIGTIGFFFLAGITWIAASFCVRLITSFAFDVWKPDTIIRWNSSNLTIEGSEKIGLVTFSIIGFIFFDVVYVVAVMNYAAQSELNIYLLRAIRMLVERKQYENMDMAIKDILECRKYLHVLNGKTATATALILFNLGAAGLVAIVTLKELSTFNVTNLPLSTVASAFNTVLWLLLVSFPFIQAARVTDACDKLKQTGPEIRSRPLQYVHMAQIDLDSYIHLTQAVRMRATMFGVPVYPWMVYGALVVFTFTALVLFQLGTYSFTRWL